jgi:KDO2-lipid IV(A) lauroyltransferase
MSQKENKVSDLVWYKRIALELLWATSYVIGYTPRWFRYHVLLPIISLALRLLRYRKEIIIKNLTSSFPEKSISEIKTIAREAYDTLAEVIVTTMALVSASPKRDKEIMVWEDYQEHIEKMKGRDWIAMAAHFGCWEYYPLWTWWDTESAFMSVYHPLRSDIFEHFYSRMRTRLSPNISVVPMKETLRHYIRNRSSERSTIIGLVSDQSPIMRADSKWMQFLNQPTLFVEGAERLATKFGMPVYYVDAERVERGRYKAKIVEIYDGKEEIEEGVIMHRYAEALEKMIRQNPELWLWSHNRWRHTPEKQAKKFGATTFK